MPSIAFGFDAENKEAQRAAARQAATLVTNVSTETKLAIRQLITRAIKDGIPPYDAGRLIEGMVGLNRRQMEAAYNLRIRLINSGLPIDKVDKRVSRYQAKALKQRGRMIARTEIMNSLANGTEESWMQAQSQGKIGANAKKEWIITPIDACNICRSIDGQQVALQAPFMSIKGTIQNPTAHPNCRCAIVVVPGPPGPAAATVVPGVSAPKSKLPWQTTRKPRRTRTRTRTRTRKPTPSSEMPSSEMPASARHHFGLDMPKPKPKPALPKPALPKPKPVKPGQKPQPLRSLNLVGGEADEALTKGIVTSQKEIAAGTSSQTLLVEGKGFKGVFKPVRGEGMYTRPRDVAQSGTSWRMRGRPAPRAGGTSLRDGITNRKFPLAEREVFAQEVDRKLGTNMIPTTRLRTVKGQGQGSIQSFVDNANAAADSSPWLGQVAKSNVSADDVTSQFILDLALGNTDRHSGNFMIGQLTKRPGREIAERTVSSIDNGLTFPAQRRFTAAYGDPKPLTYIDRLGLDEFRNETYSWLQFKDVRSIVTKQRERLLANIDATDWDKLARTTNMNGLERNAFTARMKWLRERIDKNDLFDELERLGYSNEYGFSRSNIPGVAEVVG